MIKLQPIFSDNALFLHSAPLTLRGSTDASSVSAVLTLEGKSVTTVKGAVGPDGIFEITVTTPTASFNEYDITVNADSESTTIHNVLFGELWLASGQSNMEMANVSQIEHNEYLTALADKKMRFFWQKS